MSTTRPIGRPRSSGAGCRQLKVSCADCGFIARASRGALERCGMPVCACGRPLELERVAVLQAPAVVCLPAAPSPAELEQYGANGYRRGALPGALAGSSLPAVGRRPSRAPIDPSAVKAPRDTLAELHKRAQALARAHDADRLYREAYGDAATKRAERRPLAPVWRSIGEAVEAAVREGFGLETSDLPYKPFKGHELVRAQYGPTRFATNDPKAMLRFASKHAAKAKRSRERERKARAR